MKLDTRNETKKNMVWLAEGANHGVSCGWEAITNQGAETLLFNGYSQKEYETAILNFKCGSLNNQPTKTRPNGTYSEYSILPFSSNPTIKKISPLALVGRAL